MTSVSLPIHPQQVTKQEDDSHALADHDLDRIGRRTGDHRHVVGDARNRGGPSCSGRSSAFGKRSRLSNSFWRKIVDEAERNPCEVEVADKGANSLPAHDDHQQHRQGVDQVHLAGAGAVRTVSCRRLRSGHR
jgi:hypothetical protein